MKPLLKRKYLNRNWLTTVIFFSFLLGKPSAHASVLITEIDACQSGNAEWIEITNRGDSVIDISGWKFYEQSTRHGLNFSAENSAVIAAGESLVIIDKEAEWRAVFTDYAGEIVDSSWGTLHNQGETLALWDSSSQEQDSVLYSPCEKNLSWQRQLDHTWELQTPTPGFDPALEVTTENQSLAESSAETQAASVLINNKPALSAPTVKLWFPSRGISYWEVSDGFSAENWEFIVDDKRSFTWEQLSPQNQEAVWRLKFPSSRSWLRRGGTWSWEAEGGSWFLGEYPQKKTKTSQGEKYELIWWYQDSNWIPGWWRQSAELPREIPPVPAMGADWSFSEFSPVAAADFIELQTTESSQIPYPRLLYQGREVWFSPTVWSAETSFPVWQVGGKAAEGQTILKRKSGFSKLYGTWELQAWGHTPQAKTLDTLCWYQSGSTPSTAWWERIKNWQDQGLWNGNCVFVPDWRINQSIARSVGSKNEFSAENWFIHWHGSKGSANIPHNQPPRPIIDWQNSSAHLGGAGTYQFNFDGRSSYDPDGPQEIIRWEWYHNGQWWTDRKNPLPIGLELDSRQVIELRVFDYFGDHRTARWQWIPKEKTEPLSAQYFLKRKLERRLLPEGNSDHSVDFFADFITAQKSVPPPFLTKIKTTAPNRKIDWKQNLGWAVYPKN